jgi:probable rRNA maturation factor
VNEVDVFNSTRLTIDEDAVANLVDRVLEAEGVVGGELAVEFVGERRIRELNREHRSRDEVTDVLSFPLEEPGEVPGPADPSPRLLGDIVICSRQAVRQAQGDGLPPAFEVAVLLVHGTLHLLGYDHEVDAGQMALRQAEVLELVEWEGLVAASR